MSIVINGSGTITGLSAGGLPDATITQAEIATGVAGTGPAFSAYNGVTQSISTSTLTKISFPTEEFDTKSNYDAATSRFTPTVAGYYQINGNVSFAAAGGQVIMFVYKNGARFKDGVWNTLAASGSGSSVSALVYCNGTTDYIEAYVFQTNGATIYTNISASTTPYFQASMVRGA